MSKRKDTVEISRTFGLFIALTLAGVGAWLICDGLKGQRRLLTFGLTPEAMKEAVSEGS
jgi:hypothetical protein